MNKYLSKIIIIIALLTWGLEDVVAQNDRVRYIADMLNYVEYKIESNAYDNLSVGSDKNELSADRWKSFDGLENYYYIKSNESNEAFLRLVIVETEKNNKKYQGKFLYNNDYELLYYKETLEGFEKEYNILEVYFNQNGEAIEVWQDGEIISSIMLVPAESLDLIEKESSLYSQVFQEVLMKGEAQK